MRIKGRELPVAVADQVPDFGTRGASRLDSSRAGPWRPVLWFNRVPEAKTAKNRVHVDLNVRLLDEAVERLAGLGAEKAEQHSSPSGKAWVVMRDPEGNEFCHVQAARS
jgi:hypothetical protein